MTTFIPHTSAYTHGAAEGAMHMINTASRVVQAAFAGRDALCGHPIISITSNTVDVHVCYYTRVEHAALDSTLVAQLRAALASALSRPVRLHLVRLTAPYLDAHVLAAYIARELATDTFTRVARRLFGVISPVTSQGMPLPASLVGVKLNLAGRLTAEKTRPRETTQTASLGTLSVSSSTRTQAASHTAVNAKGVYTISVWLCQRASL